MSLWFPSRPCTLLQNILQTSGTGCLQNKLQKYRMSVVSLYIQKTKPQACMKKGKVVSYGKIALRTVAATQDLLLGMPFVL